MFAQGVVKSREPAVMRVFASYVASILNGEMEIHRGYMKRLGITEEQAESVEPSLSNLSYTAYMRAVAAEEGPAEIMAAVLSCALSYEYIAKWIVQNYPDADKHAFYGEWVQGYACDAYAQENQRLTALMEQLADGLYRGAAAAPDRHFRRLLALRSDVLGHGMGTRRCDAHARIPKRRVPV